MADSNKARIEAELAGTQQVASEGAKIIGTIKGIGEASTKAGEVSKNALGGAFKSVTGILGGLASDAARAINVLGAINLAAAVEDTKRLDLATAKLGQSAGISGTQLKGAFDKLEPRTLESSAAMAEFAKSLGRVTYDSKFAVDSVEAFGTEALATGRSLGDYGQLGVVFEHLGVQSQDVTKYLGQISDVANKLGTIGGPNALKDSLAGLLSVLPGVSAHTETARVRLAALVGELGKGKTQEQQTQIAAQAISFIHSNRRKLELALGRNVINSEGEADDPLGTIKDYKKFIDSRFGKGKGQEAVKRNAILETFQPLLGSALLKFDGNEAERVASTAKDRGLAAVEAEKFRKDAPGKRIASQLEKDRQLRVAGDKLLGVHDSLVSNIGAIPTILLESQGLNIAGKGLSALGGKVAGSSTFSSVAGSGLAAAALPVAALGAVGYLGYKDIQSTAPAYADARAAQAVTQQNADAAGLTVTEYKRGQQRGESFLGLGNDVPTTPIQVDNAEIVAALDRLPLALANQLKQNPLTVKLPLDPNAPKGN